MKRYVRFRSSCRVFSRLMICACTDTSQRRYRLVADYKLRIQGQCTRDADTLTLSAGELMRVAILVIALQSAVIHNLCNIILILVFRYQIVLLYCLADDLTDRQTRG